MFGRSEELTNNISEGLNSKIIKLLVSSHPHVNKLLYTLVGVMMEAEQKYLKVLVSFYEGLSFSTVSLVYSNCDHFSEESHQLPESVRSMSGLRRLEKR